jgi:hypothetical protein
LQMSGRGRGRGRGHSRNNAAGTWHAALAKRIDAAMDPLINVHTVMGASVEYPFVSIRGTRGDVYNVSLSPVEFVCTCPDFNRSFSHGSPLCKHLVYVLHHFRGANRAEVEAVAEDLKRGATCDEALQRFKDRPMGSGGASGTLPGSAASGGASGTLPGSSGGASGAPGSTTTTTILARDCPTCVICLDDFTDTCAVSVCRVCANKFHKACIKTWVGRTSHGSCPLCKTLWK